MDFMQHALAVGKKARGISNPNPPVGAVVVADGVIVGEGCTGPAGGPHAEIKALRDSGSMAYGASIYVTLEPCCHIGRTGPCTDAIINSGISEVHVAVVDPDVRVGGKGISILRERGIKVVVGEHEKQAELDLEAHIKLSTTDLPFITVKFAVSLDGKIATRSGDSQWITNTLSRQKSHVMRMENDAVMVGINTVLMDDPKLTARGKAYSESARQPTRIIVDSNFRTPVNSSMFKERGQTIITGVFENEPLAYPTGVKTYFCSDSGGRVDLKSMLKEIGKEPISSILVEGGGELIGSLFDLGLVDKVVAFIAPVVIGGEDSPNAVKGQGALDMSAIYRLCDVKTESLGTDMMVSGYCE